MADYERSTTVNATPQALFDYLADVDNLPRYFERMVSASPGNGEEVKVAARLDGRTVEGKAWFRRNEAEKKIEWGSEGPNDYHGSLDVDGQGQNSRVTVHISTARVATEEINVGIEQTLANIKRLVEGAGVPA